MKDKKLRKKLFGKENDNCLNISEGDGFVGQTLKTVRDMKKDVAIFKNEVISLKARINKLEKKKRR